MPSDATSLHGAATPDHARLLIDVEASTVQSYVDGRRVASGVLTSRRPLYVFVDLQVPSAECRGLELQVPSAECRGLDLQVPSAESPSLEVESLPERRESARRAGLASAAARPLEETSAM